MIKTIRPTISKQDTIMLSTDIVYSQVVHHPFSPVNHPLKMSIIRHRPAGPESEKQNPQPVILWIEGGGWISMDKDFAIPELIAYAEKGYAVASIEYRVSGNAKFPAQIEDVKTAVRFLRANAKKLNINPDKIAAMGRSAGGHLAALLGTSYHVKEFDNGEWEDESSEVQAVVSLFPPIDLINMSEHPPAHDQKDSPYSSAALLLGGLVSEKKEEAKKANPIHYITKEVPPFLILHGDKDPVVPFRQSELLYKALLEAEVDAELYKVEGAGHQTPEFVQPEIQTIILEFLNKHLNIGR